MLLTRQFYVDTTKGIDWINVGHEVRQVVKGMLGENGWVVLIAPHPGAGFSLMEVMAASAVAPIRSALEGMRDSGLIRCLLPKSLVVPIEKRGLMIEPWQEIILIDYETSGRRREFRVQLFFEQEQKEANEPARQ